MKMHNNIFISTSVFSEKDLKKNLDWCLNNGYLNIELGSDINFCDDNVDIVRNFKSRSMSFLLHNYFPRPKNDFVLNLASNDSKILKKSMELCKQAVDISSELNAPFYSVHSGFALHAFPEDLGSSLAQAERIPYKEAYAIFLKNISDLAEYGRGKNVKIAVENNVISGYSRISHKEKVVLLCSPDDLFDFYRDAASSNIFFLIDLGHLNVARAVSGFDCFKFIKEAAPYTIAFHLSDNNSKDDQHLPFQGNAWFKDIIRDNQDKFFIIEASNITTNQIKRCCDAIIDFIKEGARACSL